MERWYGQRCLADFKTLLSYHVEIMELSLGRSLSPTSILLKRDGIIMYLLSHFCCPRIFLTLNLVTAKG
jgi:hypothetical protein